MGGGIGGRGGTGMGDEQQVVGQQQGDGQQLERQAGRQQRRQQPR